MLLNIRGFSVPLRRFALLAQVAFLMLSTSGASAQFYAQLDDSGNTVVYDESGAEVPVVTAIPIGERPEDCPADAYYVIELPDDMSQLVLTDCAGGQAQYTVRMTAP